MPTGGSLLLGFGETRLKLMTQLLGLGILLILVSRVGVVNWLSLIDLLGAVALINSLRWGCRLIGLPGIACRICVLLILHGWHVISHEACLVLRRPWIGRFCAVCG